MIDRYVFERMAEEFFKMIWTDAVRVFAKGRDA